MAKKIGAENGQFYEIRRKNSVIFFFKHVFMLFSESKGLVELRLLIISLVVLLPIALIQGQKYYPHRAHLAKLLLHPHQN